MAAKAASLTPDQQAQLNREAIQRLLGLATAGVGVGAGARGVMALRNLFRRPPGVEPTSSVPTSLPVYVPRHEEEPLRKTAAALKAAGMFDARPGGASWWEIPAGLTAASGGVAGGWSAIDALMNQRHKSEVSGELEDAKREYEDALRQQYLLSRKAASADASEPAEPCLGELLDGVCRLRDALQKEAAQVKEAWPSLEDAAHGVGGAYTTAALLTALGAGAGTYNWVKSRSHRRRLQDALRVRARQRTAPLPLYAYPRELPAMPASREEAA